uniref:Uncharacterized protein n=1 Tax=Arundo donax TaxID=35708 RepID=A0A0A9FC51_ARUDO
MVFLSMVEVLRWSLGHGEEEMAFPVLQCPLVTFSREGPSPFIDIAH